MLNLFGVILLDKNNPIYRDKEWLKEQYWDKYQSTHKLARLASCNDQTIRRWIRKHKIPFKTEWGEYARYTPELRSTWHRYKRESNLYEREFALTFEDFEILVTQPCHYCGKIADPINGIDRLDNDKDYILNNCVPCCKECNMLKRSMNVIDFIYQIYRIQKHCSEKYSIEHTYRRKT